MNNQTPIYKHQIITNTQLLNSRIVRCVRLLIHWLLELIWLLLNWWLVIWNIWSLITKLQDKFGPLAHLVEHHPFKVGVPRSSRGRLTRYSKARTPGGVGESFPPRFRGNRPWHVCVKVAIGAEPLWGASGWFYGVASDAFEPREAHLLSLKV